MARLLPTSARSVPALYWLVAAFALLASFAWRQRVAADTVSLRARAAAVHLHLARSDLELRWVGRQRARLEARLEVDAREARGRRARLNTLLRRLDAAERRAYEARDWAAEHRARGDGQRISPSAWHTIAPDGSCPAEVPQWDWQLLLRAAQLPPGAARLAALDALRATSNLPRSELDLLASTYARVLANPEFAGLLDADHPRCPPRAPFASVHGDRLLTISCADGAEPRYALDQRAELHTWTGPVRIGDAETVLAFCDDDLEVISHPVLKPHLLPAEPKPWELPPPPEKRRLPSVIVFMVDAVSRAHFRRSMPRTLRVLERLGAAGADTGGGGDGVGDGGGDGGAGGADGMGGGRERLHVFDFEHFNVVGYNSIPNQAPLYCGVDADGLTTLRGEQCAWQFFKDRGGVSMFAEEVHDGCEGATGMMQVGRLDLVARLGALDDELLITISGSARHFPYPAGGRAQRVLRRSGHDAAPPVVAAILLEARQVRSRRHLGV